MAGPKRIIIKSRSGKHGFGAESDELEQAPVEEVSPARREAVLEAFGKVWGLLFESPVHLDSALSKLQPNLKKTLAQIVPRLLLRPASEAEALGVGVAPGEPWSLDRGA